MASPSIESSDAELQPYGANGDIPKPLQIVKRSYNRRITGQVIGLGIQGARQNGADTDTDESLGSAEYPADDRSLTVPKRRGQRSRQAFDQFNCGWDEFGRLVHPGGTRYVLSPDRGSLAYGLLTNLFPQGILGATQKKRPPRYVE